ncbi:M48 family metallopeptidase [Hydrogenophaga sp. 5NK40-0174]|uniref:M48 family metallopeptidase n=1 Tax=Hydrogenophaga sp. 5NK40-0174 TaxID=3127649 RepID=UPI003103DB17
MEGAFSTLTSVWYDGQTPKPRTVWLRLEEGELRFRSEDGQSRAYPVRQVRWPERTRHGQRQVYLPDGGMIVHADGPEWDMWRESHGHEDSAVVQMMQSWRGAFMSAAGTVAFLVGAWLWGVPIAASVMADMVPAAVEESIGDYSMKQLDKMFLDDSELPEAQQTALRQRFEAVVQEAYRHRDAPPEWQLSFHKAKLLGPNAFALPGGHMVVTDELVRLLEDEPDAIVGVLAHELGHVEHKHGLNMLFRSSMLSALAGLVLGDASTFLTTIPLTLTTQGYSRDVEREADAHSAQMLHDAGISPAVMALFFERMGSSGRGRKADEHSGHEEDGGHDDEGGDGLGIAISSHPGDQERIRYFRTWRPDAVQE